MNDGCLWPGRPPPADRLWCRLRAVSRCGARRAVNRGQNIAHTTLPVSLGVKPHWSLRAQMMCNPRPVSAKEPRVCSTGAARLGSATAHRTQDPGCSRPNRIGRRGQLSPAPGRPCRNALASSSDTTIAMSWLRSVVPQRRKVAIVKSRAARTDPASAPSVRVATRGKLTGPGEAGSGEAGSGDGRRLPLVRPAISAASVSQRLPACGHRPG